MSFMSKYNVREVYEQIVTKGLKNWTKRQLPGEARESKSGAERWSYWRKRLEELSRGNADDEVNIAARESLEYMLSEV